MKRLFLSAALALVATSALAQVKISELPAGVALDGTEAIPAVQGSTVKTTPAAIATYVLTQDAVDIIAAESVLVDSADIQLTGPTTVTGNVLVNGNVNLDAGGGSDEIAVTSGNTAITGSVLVGSATGGQQGAGSLNAQALYVNGVAVSAGGAALTTGTFTATWDVACTTNPTQNFKWVKVGTVVTLTALQDVSCTSDTGGFSTQAAGGLPATIRPDKQQRLLGARFTDNGTVDVQAGCLRIETDGTMSLFRSVASPCVGTAWTGSGAKAWTVDGVAPAVWTYDTDVVP